MMRGIIQTSLSFRFLVIVITAVLVVFGINQMANMPMDVLPEFSPPYVEIQTEALGLSAEEVEQMITVPMEQDLLAGVAWLDVIRSESVPGLSSVLVYFEPGTDLYQARQMVSERMAQAAVGIPHVSKPPTMIQPLSSASRFMIIGMSSKELSLIQMSVLARWTIGPRLMGVPGVAHVAIWGNRDRQLQVQVDPARLHAQGVTLDQVIETTGNALWVSSLTFLEASSPGTGGFIDTPNQRLSIWHELPISSPEELAQVPIEGAESLLLGDVAQVVEDHQPLIGDAVVNDRPNLLLVIEKLPGMNTLQVTKDIEAALDALRPGFTAIDFDATLFRPATFIEMAIGNFTKTAAIATILIILVLAAFLSGWRSMVISLVAIAASLVAAMYVLYLRGATINAMVLAGMAVALSAVIDEAIVDVEHVVRMLRQNRQLGNPKSPDKVILDALVEMRNGIFFATLITLIAVLPIFFIASTLAALVQTLAFSYVLAVLAALVVSLTVTPALSFVLLSNDKLEHRESSLIAGLQRGYEKFLAGFIQKPGAAYAVVVVLFIAGIAVLPFAGRQQLLPTFKEPYILINVAGAPATSQPAMERIISRLSSELRTIAGVQNVGANVGRAVFGDQVVGINSAQLWVKVDPQADYETTVAAISEVANGYIGMDAHVQTYTDQALGNPTVDESDVVTLRIFGEDHKVLRTEAEKLHQALAGTASVTDSRVVLPVEEPTLEIEVNLPVAQQYGIRPGDVRRAAATLLSGIQVGSLFEEQKIFDVVVWSTPDTRNSATDLRDLMIDTPDGGQVRLGDIANINMVASPTVVRREAISPYLDIKFTIAGRSLSEAAKELEASARKYAYPLEYHAEIVGDYSAQRTVQQSILISGIIALIGIFLLLQAASGNWSMALVTFLALPAALAGGILVAYLTGSLVSLFGLLAVLGLTARSAITMINHYQRLELVEGEPFSPDLVVRGSRERLAATLLTTLATGFAFLPFAIMGSISGQEIIFPIAVVILGGLVTSTFFNLLVVPALYLRFGAHREANLELVPEPATD